MDFANFHFRNVFSKTLFYAAEESSLLENSLWKWKSAKTGITSMSHLFSFQKEYLVLALEVLFENKGHSNIDCLKYVSSNLETSNFGHDSGQLFVSTSTPFQEIN